LNKHLLVKLEGKKMASKTLKSHLISLAVLLCILGVAENARSQSITSSVVESYLNTGVGTVTVTNESGSTTTSTSYSNEQYQPDAAYVSGAYQNIDLSGSGNPNVLNTAGYFDFDADTSYGYNHASAYVQSRTDPYFSGDAFSSYSDIFTVSTLPSASVYGAASYVQFNVAVDGSATGDVRTSYDIEDDVALGPSSLFGPTANQSKVTGTLLGYDNEFDYSFFGTISEDSFGLSGAGTANLTSQVYSIVNGSIDATFALDLNTNPGFYLSPTGIGYADANFSNTAILDGLSVYNQNGQLIPLADLSITDASGATYPFAQGSVPAPESSTALSTAIGLATLLLFGLYSRTKVRRQSAIANLT
jgi:hypothetical protein